MRIFCYILVLFFGSYGFASDAKASLGISLHPDLHILRYDIKLSPYKTNVSALIFNSSALDVTQTLNFSFPKIDSNVDSLSNAFDTSNLDIKANGKNINFNIIKKANKNIIDVSSILEKYNIPLNPLLARKKILDAELKPNQMETLINKKLVGYIKKEPLWSMQEFIVWRQLFPVAEKTHLNYKYPTSTKDFTVDFKNIDNIEKLVCFRPKHEDKVSIAKIEPMQNISFHNINTLTLTLDIPENTHIAHCLPNKQVVWGPKVITQKLNNAILDKPLYIGFFKQN